MTLNFEQKNHVTGMKMTQVLLLNQRQNYAAIQWLTSWKS